MRYRLLFVRGVLAFACCLAICGCSKLHSWDDSSYRIQTSRLDHWHSYGGAWELTNNAIHNNSDERGAKLLTGSYQWADYTLTAEIKFDGDHGDMGVIVRSNREEEGVDAYDGYYVGLRTWDGTLVTGRSNYGWVEARPVAMPGGAHASTWYRLVVTVVGCKIASSSQNLSTGQTAWLAFQDPNCVRSGRIGLRSLGTGGIWKAISVSPASMSDYTALASHAASLEQPEFPKREADYNRYYRFYSTEHVSMQPAEPNQAASDARLRISDLQNLPRNTQTSVNVRGIVTLTSPGFYVQDASGAVLVSGVALPSVNVGDTVEISGMVQPGLFSPVIHQAKVRPMWSGTPAPPVSVTALQAASGAYDAHFIEVEGTLTSIETDASGYTVLNLEDSGQTFRAVYKDQSGKPIHRLEKNSYLRLRGVCVIDRVYTGAITPFAVLLRSDGDLQILSGPPWWTPVHVTMLFAGLLLLALLAQIVYFRIQRWKALAITQERERLAHEIHDTMAQSFAGVGYQIQGIRSSVLRGEQKDSSYIANQLNVAYQLVRRCHEEASQTVAMLASSTPIPNDLLSELEATTHRIAAGQVQTKTETLGTPVELNLRLVNALLHMGQEAVTNALRHSEATVIRLTLAFEADRVRLTVADDGKGFDPSINKSGFGIQGMQKRAREIGADLHIHAVPGSGTEVVVIADVQQTTFTSRLLTLVRGIVS
jgi:signal transduction histidine kinase